MKTQLTTRRQETVPRTPVPIAVVKADCSKVPTRRPVARSALAAPNPRSPIGCRQLDADSYEFAVRSVARNRSGSLCRTGSAQFRTRNTPCFGRCERLHRETCGPRDGVILSQWFGFGFRRWRSSELGFNGSQGEESRRRDGEDHPARPQIRARRDDGIRAFPSPSWNIPARLAHRIRIPRDPHGRLPTRVPTLPGDRRASARQYRPTG